MSEDADRLEAARSNFVQGWGALGSSEEPLSTDDVMEQLGISRGNANTTLRELVGWGLIRRVVRVGERREYFEAEKDVWTIFRTLARERKRREIEPALALLQQCLEQTKGLRTAKAFHTKLSELRDFVALANTVLDRIAASEKSKVIPAVLKWLK
jgi:DNA-binding transcriptional regulator GbsR (MarR family)